MEHSELRPNILEETSALTEVSDDVYFTTRVILFNDDYHTFDEVINQIIKAIACSFEKARALTSEVHYKGKAAIYEGELKECLRISAVLEEINLHTQIEC
ncbi:MAG: ATP-dependent Clp protease adaptor ClpS [Candidatus Kapaibacterium sp.]|jgi:ATP-dependent Clp protease adaptor protein ClpS